MKILSVICCCLVLSCGNAVMANLSGSDDFNDNIIDPSKWTDLFRTPLTETNGRLEYSGGSGDVVESLQWQLNRGSYVQDWTVSLDVVNSVDISTMSNQEIGFGFLAFSPGPFENNFSIDLKAGDDAGGSNRYRRISTQAENSNVQVLDHAADTTATSLRLQISFDASAKVFTSYYDSGGGLTALTNYNVSAWGMSDRDVFAIAVFGIGYDVTPASGEVFGDNFVAVPEPGTLGLLGIAAGGLLLARCKKR